MSDSPNILLILTDQQRFDSLAANGNTICHTPATNRLAEEGMLFRHAFTPTALCSPARASLLTGLLPHNHTMTNLTNTRIPSVTELPQHLPSFAASLSQVGYRTSYVGKWHSGRSRGPQHWGFADDEPGEGWHEWWPEGVELEEESTVRLGYDKTKPMAARVPRPLDQYPEVGRTDAAISLLEQHAEQDTPFCLQLNYFGPHYPHYLPEPYHSMYESAAIPPWGNFQDRPQTPHYGYRWLRQRWCAPSDDWAHYARILAAYYGQITLLEHQIERVLQSLDRLGLTSSTLVIFTSDHGEMGGGHGLLQKGAVPYDELYRIPLIARWPGVIDAGRTCDAMVSHIDLMPTLLEVGGAPPAQVDGRSILPWIHGKPPGDWPDEVFCEYLATQAGDTELKMVRTPTHKLAVNLSDRDELYDLHADLGETANLIDDPASVEVRHRLAARLDAQMAWTNDPLRTRFRQRMAGFLGSPDMQ